MVGDKIFFGTKAHDEDLTKDEIDLFDMMAEIAVAYSWTPEYMDTFTRRELSMWYRKAFEKRANDRKELVELVTYVVGRALGGE